MYSGIPTASLWRVEIRTLYPKNIITERLYSPLIERRGVITDVIIIGLTS